MEPSYKTLYFKRYFNENNEEPYAVIIQDMQRRKLNPLHVGKFIKNHCNDIEFERTGKNLLVT